MELTRWESLPGWRCSSNRSCFCSMDHLYVSHICYLSRTIFQKNGTSVPSCLCRDLMALDISFNEVFPCVFKDTWPNLFLLSWPEFWNLIWEYLLALEKINMPQVLVSILCLPSSAVLHIRMEVLLRCMLAVIFKKIFGIFDRVTCYFQL